MVLNSAGTGKGLKPAFVTLTNAGYLPYTLNCLESLRRIGFDDLPVCYCCDRESEHELRSRGIKTRLFTWNDRPVSGLAGYEDRQFSNIVFNKLKILHHALMENELVLYTDGDIVFKNREFFRATIDQLGDCDLVMQSDEMSNNQSSNLCAGFMLIRSTPTTRSIMAAEDIRPQKGFHDQTYLNNRKALLSYNWLPLELFPNGQYYFANKDKIKDPYLLHFNWLVGQDKYICMREHNQWLIDEVPQH